MKGSRRFWYKMVWVCRGSAVAFVACTVLLIGCTGVVSISCGSASCLRGGAHDTGRPAQGVGSLTPFGFVNSVKPFSATSVVGLERRIVFGA